MKIAPHLTDPKDVAHMRVALGLARRGLGRVAPNPSVGCVLVRDGHVVGRGWTQPGGRPHGETEALHRAGDAARGSTAYVSLEPCAHYGKTPPCANALIEAGIRRAVVAIQDPDPRVAGRGLVMMQEAGIEVTLGVCAEEAAELNQGFLMRMCQGRPMVTLKLATSLDGHIATSSGQSQWITGPEARAAGHLLRHTHDAVMIGSGTALADDPQLTVRLPGLDEQAQPVRIVVDGRLRLSLTSQLARTAREIRTIVVVLPHADKVRVEAFRSCGIEIVTVHADASGRPDLAEMLQQFGTLGLTRILCEGGSNLAASLLQADLVDRLAWFRSAGIIGGDGLRAIQPMGLTLLANQHRFERVGVAGCGDDLLERLNRIR